MKVSTKILIFLIVFLIPWTGYALKFKLLNNKGKEYTLQATFDTGFSAQGVTDGAGITDYESVFFKPAFHFEDFGLELVFDFRFRFIAGEFTFKKSDWYIEDNGVFLNPELNTFILYLDKINYIVYGNLNAPIYGHFGKNPVMTFGTGLVVKNFHNNSFAPTSRELGIAFRFNGNLLNQYKFQSFPFDLTFLMNDIVDPDIMMLDCGVDIFKFTPLMDRFNLRLGLTAAFDYNTGESNRLSALNTADIVSHRNLSTTNYNQYTSFPLFLEPYADFYWNGKDSRINGFIDSGFLLDNHPVNGFNFGFGIKTGVEAKFINLLYSGYLIGILAGFIVESPHYAIDYFSSNYEVLRTKQYLALSKNTDYTFYLMAGFGLYAFYDRLQFKFQMTMPLVSLFAARFSAKFVLEDTVITGLYVGTYYETGVNTMYREANNGSAFIDSLTRDFRFSFEAGYKFYGAKFSLIIGVQRPGWVSPILISGKQNLSPYTKIAQGEYVPTQAVDPIGYKDYDWEMNLEDYANQLEKFVSLEISFVF